MSAERSPTNVPVSVRARLSDLARRQGIEFQLVLAEFAIERLLSNLLLATLRVAGVEVETFSDSTEALVL